MVLSQQNESILVVRRITQAPVVDCKKFLELSNWNIEEAVRLIARKKHDEKTNKSHEFYGIVCLYSHQFGRVGVMVELSCESGYIAKSLDFIKLANTIAVQIAWSNPKGLDRQDVQQCFGEVCLLDQVEMKETQGQRTIKELLAELSCKTGENIKIVRFARFDVGDFKMETDSEL
jgi:elongation factor Ts